MLRSVKILEKSEKNDSARATHFVKCFSYIGYNQMKPVASLSYLLFPIKSELKMLVNECKTLYIDINNV